MSDEPPPDCTSDNEYEPYTYKGVPLYCQGGKWRRYDDGPTSDYVRVAKVVRQLNALGIAASMFGADDELVDTDDVFKIPDEPPDDPIQNQGPVINA